jgi:hypothetical protein
VGKATYTDPEGIFDCNETYGCPSDLVPPEKKDEVWMLKRVKYIYAQQLRGYYIPTAHREQIVINRTYAQGNQSITPYSEQLNSQSKDDQERRSYANINYGILAIVPKFIDIVLGYYLKKGEMMSATAIDDQAVNEKNQAKADLQAKVSLKELFTWMAKMGIGKTPDDNLPSNMDEVDMEMQLNYKQMHEIMMEEGLRLIFWDNKVDKEVKKQCLIDAFTDGRIAVKRSLDVNGKILIRRVDNLEAIFGFSKRLDKEDLDIAAEPVYMTIGELARDSNGKFTNEELCKIAQQYNGLYGNPNEAIAYYYYQNWQFTDFPFYGYRIKVLDAEVRTVNNYSFKTGTKKGKKYSYPVSSDYKSGSYEKQELGEKIVQKEFSVWMTAKWVVGSNYIYNVGNLEEGVRGKNPAEGHSSFYVAQIATVPVVERVIPAADMFQLAHLRKQGIICKLRPPGLAMEIESALQTVQDMKLTTTLQLEDMYNATGNFYYRIHNPDDPNILNQMPFKELAGGDAGALAVADQSMNESLNQIRLIFSTEMGADASPTAPRVSATSSEIALQGTDNALTPIYSAWVDMKEDLARDTAYQLQLLVKRGGEYSGYIESFGSNLTKYIKVTSDIAEREMAIMIQALPSDQEQQDLKDTAKLAYNQRLTSGTGGITLEDYFAVCDALKVSIKKAQYLLSIRIKRNAAKDAQLASAQAKEKSQIDQQSGQAASQNRQQEIGAEHDSKADLITKQALAQMDVDNNKSKNTIREIQEKNKSKETIEDAKIEAKQELEDSKLTV